MAELRTGDALVGLIGGPMHVAQIGQRLAVVTGNLGNIIELAEPRTWTRPEPASPPPA